MRPQIVDADTRVHRVGVHQDFTSPRGVLRQTHRQSQIKALTRSSYCQNTIAPTVCRLGTLLVRVFKLEIFGFEQFGFLKLLLCQTALETLACQVTGVNSLQRLKRPVFNSINQQSSSSANFVKLLYFSSNPGPAAIRLLAQKSAQV